MSFDHIDDLDQALEEMLNPPDTSTRLSYVQMRAANHADLLAGIGAAGRYLNPGDLVVGIRFTSIQAEDLRPEMATMVIERSTAAHAWTDDPNQPFSLRVSTADGPESW